MLNVFRSGRIGPVLCLVGAALVASPAIAGEATGTSPSLQATNPAALAGLFKRYGVELQHDPQSDRFQSPTAEQLAALRAALLPLMKQSETPTAPMRHPSGMVQNHLGLWNFGASYAFLDPEAGLEMRCVAKLQDLARPAAPEKEVE